MGSIDKHGQKWRARWTDESGKRRTEVFEDHNTARRELARREADVDAIRKGERRRVVEDKTFADLTRHWLDVRAVDKRSKKDDESILRAHLTPAFGALKLKAIDVEAVDRFTADRRHLDKKTVHNHLTLLRTMLNAAVDLGWLHLVPRFKKPKLRLFEEDFAYLRNDDEIARFLSTARANEGEQAHALFAMATYTGLRAGELAGLRWSDVDVAKRMITVQRSFDGPTKSGDVRHVPILDVLLPVLSSWRSQHPGDHVFTNRDGGPLQPSGRIFQEVFHRVLDSAGFPSRTVRNQERPYIRFHDLRHTFASTWVAKGGDIFKLQKILGHKSQTMTQRYAHLAPTAFVEDFGRFGPVSCTDSRSGLQEMPQGKPEPVVLQMTQRGRTGATKHEDRDKLGADVVGHLAKVVELRRRRP